MPSVDKAILHPFNALSVTDALLVAVCGMVVVFLMLAILAAVIMVISKVVANIESKAAPAKKAAPAPKKAAPAAAPAAPAAPKEDEDELIAVITAAVAAEMGTTPDATRLTSIMRY